jgi:hypothetical protein
MPTAITASDYSIELRNKAGHLKQYITPFVSDVSWEWNRIGGCGNCRLVIKKEYRSIEFQAMDDIQIRVKNESYRDAATRLQLPLSVFPFTDDTGKTVINNNVTLDGTGKGACFNGTNATLQIADWVDLMVGDFTIESKVMFNTCSAGTSYVLFSQYVDATHYWYLRKNDDTGLHWRFYYKNGADVIDVKNGSNPPTGQSMHVSLVKKDNIFNIRIDGVSAASGTSSVTLANLNAPLVIGSGNGVAFLDGWMKDVRISNIARYAADFTPPAYSFSANPNPTRLVYRGWISNISPALQINQSITLDVRGYFDILNLLIVHDAGDKKVYQNTEISEIVTDIIDDFVNPNTTITKGTIDTSGFAIDVLEFKNTVKETLQTLAELLGDIEYGVNENLVFFWRTESATLRQKFFVGNDVELFERKTDWSKLVNRVLFQGSDDENGIPFLKVGEATDSQTAYFISEIIVNNSAISTDVVADLYIGATLRENSNPVLNIHAKIHNTALRLEDTVPIGEVAVYDVDHDQNTMIVGETADGGSNLTLGEAVDGGSGAIVGSVYASQIDRISYKLSQTSGRFDIDITFGDTMLETAAIIKRIENNVNALRER